MKRSFCSPELLRQFHFLAPKLRFIGLEFSHLLLCERFMGAAL